MDKVSKKPIIVAIEGVDSVGKHTLALGLLKLATENNYTTKHLAFPNYDEPYTGKFISDYLSGNQLQPCNLEVFQVFCALNRKLTMNQVTEKVDLLILDRFSVSSLAYRSALNFENITKEKYQALCLQLENDLLNLPVPDLCLLCLLPIDEIATRLKRKKRDVHEQNLRYLDRVQNEYLACYQNRNQQNWYKVPAASPPKMAVAAWQEISKLL